MSEIPEDLRYTKTHEWVRLDEDGSVTVGITDHAQELLGDLVFVECPEVGMRVKAEQACAVVESVKAASDIYAPLAGEIIEINEALSDSPEIINQDECTVIRLIEFCGKTIADKAGCTCDDDHNSSTSL